MVNKPVKMSMWNEICVILIEHLQYTHVICYTDKNCTSQWSEVVSGCLLVSQKIRIISSNETCLADTESVSDGNILILLQFYFNLFQFTSLGISLANFKIMYGVTYFNIECSSLKCQSMPNDDVCNREHVVVSFVFYQPL